MAFTGPVVNVPHEVAPPRPWTIKDIVGDYVRVPGLGRGQIIEVEENNDESCAVVYETAANCWITPKPAAAEKQFTAGGRVNDESQAVFAGYTGVECYLGGDNEAHFEASARRAMEKADYRFVEEHLVKMVDSTLPKDPDPYAPVTYNSIAAAIGWADRRTSQSLSSKFLVIMSRSLATIAYSERAIIADGTGALWTPLGMPVLAVDDPQNTALPVGDQAELFYVIGWPTIYASDIVTSTGRDITKNKVMALAERFFAISIDCAIMHGYKVWMKGPKHTTTPPAPPAPPAVGLLTIGTVPASPVEVGTDVTVHVHSEEALDGEVHLHLQVNGGGWTDLGEMTQTSSDEYVFNLQTDSHDAGDVLEVYANADSAMSETIDIHLEAS